MQTKVLGAGIVFLVGLFVLSAQPVHATHTTGFNWNLIILDEQFTDTSTMSVQKVQEFLDTQPGMLKTHSENGKTAAQIIYDASQANRINPRVLLTNMQKESSMITRTSFPSGQQYYLDWVMFYGWCDSCSTGTNKGFTNQINAAAAAFRRYLDAIATQSYTVSGWGPGRTKSISCIQSDFSNGRELCTPDTKIDITPANAATAALFTYTPHPGGNFAFWYHWKNFNFNLGKLYPDGSLLRAKGTADIWLVENGMKRRFTNSAAFLSRYNFSRVITVPADHLYVYDTGREISYANYSLLSSPTGGVYLLVDDTKRPITSRKAFQNAGFRREEVIKVSWDALNQFTDGQDITTENIYPSGMLMQNKKSGVVYFVKDGVKSLIVCREIMRSQFGKRKPIPVGPNQLDTYANGAPVGFKEGDLVTSGGPAYVISDGQKLPIANRETFKAYGFAWANVQKVSADCLSVHPEGPVLDTLKVQSAGL